MIDPKAVFKFNPEPVPGSGYRAQWQVPSDLAYFDGHFPGNPVLPAVAIIDATEVLIQQAAGDGAGSLTGVKSAKFMSPILPGMLLEIGIHNLSENEWQATWRNLRCPKRTV